MNRPGRQHPNQEAAGEGDGDFPTTPTGVGDSNQAFLLAMAAWAVNSDGSPNSSSSGKLGFQDKLQKHLSPSILAELNPHLKNLQRSTGETIPASVAIQRLRHLHHANSRPDLDRIHPSWWLRALQQEPDSVRATIARHGPESVRESLRNVLGDEDNRLANTRPIPDEVLSWILALWSERLVGDIPERDDDPLVIITLTRLTPRSIHRVLRLIGLIKLTLADLGSGDANWFRPQPLDEARIVAVRRFFEPVDSSTNESARHDLKSLATVKGKATSSRRLAILGLASISQLLADCSPHRTRWALQHLPYPIAKRIRNTMPRNSSPPKDRIRFENLVLTAAWQRLDNEGRILVMRPRCFQSGDGSPSL